MSNSCEESLAEESAVSSSLQLPVEYHSEFKAEHPELETTVTEQGERDDMSPNDVVEKTVNGSPSTCTDHTGSTPVKRFVIADSDDDVTDDEGNDFHPSNPVCGMYTGDHDYAATYSTNFTDDVKTSEGFPLIPGLSEIGVISDDLEIPLEQHPQSRVASTSHVGYEHREPNIINRASPNGERVRDGVYRATEGQSSYFARSSRSNIPNPGYRSIQVPQDRSMSLPQQQQHFVVSGYNAAPMARRVMTSVPISSPAIIQQKRTAPRIVSNSAHLRSQGTRLVSNAPHLVLQQSTQRQTSNASAPSVQRQVDPPPHRSYHQGSDPPPHRVLLLQGNAGSRVAFSPADPSQAALANAPAPLIVSSRGTRPIVRGRGGSAGGRVKKDGISGISAEETSPAHSPQPCISTDVPQHVSRTALVSPRKQVHFSDGVALGSHSSGTSSPFNMQTIRQNLVHDNADVTSYQGSVRSPPKLVLSHIRSPNASFSAYHPATEIADHAMSSRKTHIIPETSLPDNFVDVGEASAGYHDASSKNATLPSDVIEAATSLSAQSDASHPQWANTDISEEDIKAKIEAISREIAQELEQKRLESESQIREKRRPMNETPRRRLGNEGYSNDGGPIEDEGAPIAPRGRGRPKGSGRTRSSLSSSSNTSIAATSINSSHLDVADGPSSSSKTVNFQSVRTAGRPSNKHCLSSPDYDVASEPHSSLPSFTGTALRNRGPYNTNLASFSEVRVQQVPTQHTANSVNCKQRDVNGLHQNDLDTTSTDASCDEEGTIEEAEWGDYVTRCLCEMQHNDEWMVECERCNVWQHMKCMGLDPKKFNQNDSYLCEICNPRPLKWTKKQAQELQLKQLKAVARETERKMSGKLKRREEKKLVKLNSRLKDNNARNAKRGTAAFKKFQVIERNEYTKRAKQMLALFDTTAGAQSILENSRDLRRGKRMFVAPDVEGLVATECIKQDEVIMEYLGHVCLPDECPGRLQRGALQPFCVLYNGLGQNLLCIDARRQGSDARFARRCCRSNSTLKHVLLNGCIYVMLVASEKIEKGTEVTIPFDCDFRDTLVPIECACGDDPNCYMKQFNNSLRGKLSFVAEQPVSNFPTPAQSPSILNSDRRVSSTQGVKIESRGRPKKTRKNEKSGGKLLKKRVASKKQRKIGIRLRRHSDSKNVKSSDDSTGHGVEVNHGNEREVETVEEKKEVESSPIRSSEDIRQSETEKEDKLMEDKPQLSSTTEAVNAMEVASCSQKEEHRGDTKRRGSEGLSRIPKRETVELKEVMDYTLPEDRNKPSREERKLQAVVAAFEKKERKENRKKSGVHKDPNENKSHKNTGSRITRAGSSNFGRGSRHDVDNSAERKNYRENRSDTAEQPSRGSLRSKNKREDSKENEILEATAVVQPPRKRWAAAVKENEVAHRASSPEVTSSSSATSVGASDITSENSMSLSSVGGKKLWLRRHAAESVSEESLQNTDISASYEPLSCAADSTSDITAVPSKVQASPLKKRRHALDVCQYDEHVAATALAQMGGKSGGFRFHWSAALRYLIPNLIASQQIEFCLTEIVQKPLPSPSSRITTKVPTSVADTPSAAQLPVIAPVETRKAKRLSLEDYKKRRSTMGSSENKNAPNKTSTSSVSGNATVDNKNSIGSGMARSTRSFIPLMDSVEQNAVLRPLETDIPMPSLGVPPDLEVVKKMILQESCIPPPPAPPSLPTQKESPARAGLTSSSDMSIGSSSESGEERMSLADRLAKEFGVGTAGTNRCSPRTTPTQRITLTPDVPPPPPPPPPPPGPRPTRIVR